MTSSADEKKSPFLPDNVSPVRYDIVLDPDLEKFTFDGEETIEVKVNKTTNQIVLNSAEIEISSVELDSVKAAKIEYNTKDERATFTFDKELEPGNYKLFIKFKGQINDKLAGFYRSKYKDAEGKEKFMATTQFEATDARKAFPCWDEPAAKAIFKITIIAPSHLVTVSNMPEVKREKVSDTKVRIEFDDSPVMSTYLVAYIIGEFDTIEGKSENGTLIRIFTPVGKKEQGRFPLVIALQTLTYYESLFGIRFPLPKLDLLAIPDFAAGAMENWGAITYREARLLIDPVKTSTALKLANMKTINHEIAHMWFGNLVTMKWWDNLWLNEGFARYMEQIPVAKFYPEYDIWTQFVAGCWATALDLDSLRTSHPVEVPVNHPDEINEIFDSISYAKGASIIRMIADFVGEEAFFSGLNSYLSKHKYKNAITEQLWEALAEASGKPVQRVMDTWTKQMGYPVITVEELDDGSSGVQQIKLTQKRFLASGDVGPADEQKWIVPITIRTAVDVTKLIMEDESITVSVPVGKGDDSWVKVNERHVGFYRVNYTKTLWDKLGATIKKRVLSASDRLGLLTDASALASSGLLSTAQFLSFLLNYSEEDEYPVYASISSAMSSLNTLLDQEACYPQFLNFVKKLMLPTFNKLGWDPKPDEPQLYALMRPMILAHLGNVKDADIIATAQEKFKLYLQNRDLVTADLHYPILKIIARQGNEETFALFQKMYAESDFSEEQRNLLRALGQFQDRELIKKALDYALSNNVRSQDCIFLIGSAAHNPAGRYVAWDWMVENWSTIDRLAVGQNFIISGIVSSCSSYFTSLERAQLVEEFFTQHPVPTAARTIKQSIESIRSNAKWLQRDLEAIQQWLSQ